MGAQLKNTLEARFREIFGNIENSGNTANQKAALMAEAVATIIDNLKITIPPGQVLIGATGGVPNPAPIECEVESR